MLEILLVCNVAHNPDSGSGYVIDGYQRGLKCAGHTVDIYGRETWAWISVTRGRRYIYPLMIAASGISAVIRYSYDIVELWGGECWLLALLLRKLYPELPIVHHSNGIEQHRIEVQRDAPSPDIQNVRWFQWDLSRFHDLGLKAVDAIITVSSYDIPFLLKRSYVSPEACHAIPNPLPDIFLERDVHFTRPCRIGYCGSWTNVKNCRLMEKDIESFLRSHSDWKFSVVGAGNTDVAAQFSPDVRGQIEVIPFLEREKLTAWYESLAVFVLPSIYESFGLVMAEAMACGAALVATNVGFAHGLNHEEEALILPEKTSPHLRDALGRLASDEALRRRLARNGYESVQSLRWDDAVGQLESIYKNIVAKKKTATSSF